MENVTYLIVPKMEYMVLRVKGHHKNRRKLIKSVRNGDVSTGRVRNESKILWSRVRIRQEIIK